MSHTARVRVHLGHHRLRRTVRFRLVIPAITHCLIQPDKAWTDVPAPLWVPLAPSMSDVSQSYAAAKGAHDAFSADASATFLSMLVDLHLPRTCTKDKGTPLRA